MPLPLAEFPLETLRQITTLCFDLDDTVTTHGRLTPDVYAAFWRLAEAGVRLIPVTGRPAGWADQIARWWPVDAVVSENGAVLFRLEPQDNGVSVMRHHFTAAENREHALQIQSQLQIVRDEILERWPEVKVAADQPYRLWDLAIDFAEDVPKASDEVIQGICDVFEQHGATCKVSSIHVNGWFGEVNKLDGIRTALQLFFGQSLQRELDHCIFVGDSPNDEPMFGFFPHSIGVANVEPFLPSLTTPPSYICRQNEGWGFLEVANLLLESRDLS
jgi:HAD superfamily hydrolase (TIGR01484 family)